MPPSDKLETKPCPFCGCSSIYMDGPMVIDGDDHHFMVCLTCGAEGPVQKSQLTARYLWNRRPL